MGDPVAERHQEVSSGHSTVESLIMRLEGRAESLNQRAVTNKLE